MERRLSPGVSRWLFHVEQHHRRTAEPPDESENEHEPFTEPMMIDVATVRDAGTAAVSARRERRVAFEGRDAG
ncbi:hypothetical protein AB0E56_03000 [Microbacterium sp. NPDC028030]|uniref:hypothetical protein n=1 Tax=Microbacterium sp. NPDC028030 TaxID=3155124 RepID=UPI0033FADFEA